MCQLCDKLVNLMRRGDWFQINTFFSGNRFDIHLKSPNISLKTGLLKLMSIITWLKLDKKFSKWFEDSDGERQTTRT